jgi:hypothetical protein
MDTYLFLDLICSRITIIIEATKDTNMKCDKCGIIVDGGVRKLNRHKSENHSY